MLVWTARPAPVRTTSKSWKDGSAAEGTTALCAISESYVSVSSFLTTPTTFP